MHGVVAGGPGFFPLCTAQTSIRRRCFAGCESDSHVLDTRRRENCRASPPAVLCMSLLITACRSNAVAVQRGNTLRTVMMTAAKKLALKLQCFHPYYASSPFGAPSVMSLLVRLNCNRLRPWARVRSGGVFAPLNFTDELNLRTSLERCVRNLPLVSAPSSSLRYVQAIVAVLLWTRFAGLPFSS